MQSDAISETDALDLARKWVADRMPPPKTSYLFSQMRWLLSELVDRCVAETLRLREDEDALYDQLAHVHDIIFVAQTNLTSSLSARLHAKAAERPGEDEQKRMDRETHTLWVRRDPKVAFNDGFESPEQFNCAEDELCEIVASYLSRPWLRHPFLDWVFVDVLVTRELCTFGEEIKKRFLPGKRDKILKIHHAYMETKGNLKKMLAADATSTLKLCGGLFLGFGVAPLGLAWGAFQTDQESLGRWLLAIYALIVAVYLGSKTVGLVVRLGQRLQGVPAPEPPHQQILHLWDEMYEVWRRLAPPTVSPVRLKEALSTSEKQGAAWRSEIWSLVDRAIAADQTAWIVQRS